MLMDQFTCSHLFEQHRRRNNLWMAFGYFKSNLPLLWSRWGGTRIWTRDLLICSQMLYHWAIPPLSVNYVKITWFHDWEFLAKKMVCRKGTSQMLRREILNYKLFEWQKSGSIAQWLEHCSSKAGVVSSILAGAFIAACIWTSFSIWEDNVT